MNKLLISALVASTSMATLAAESIDIRVIGTISASSCVPQASGGGVVDYGHISPDSLSETGVTVLPPKTIAFNINCDGPMNVALRAHSNRFDTTINTVGAESLVGTALVTNDVKTAGFGVGMPIAQPNVQNPVVAGLGVANGQKIGGYSLTLPPSTITIDGVPATYKFYTRSQTPSSSAVWTSELSSIVSNNGHSLFSNDNAFSTYSNTSTYVDGPTAFENLEGTLIVQGYITEKENLDLSTPINLDGSATIELYYF